MYGPPQQTRMTPMTRAPAMSGVPNNIQPGMRPMPPPTGAPMQPPMGPRPMVGMAAPQQAGMPMGGPAAPAPMNRQQMIAQALRGAVR